MEVTTPRRKPGPVPRIVDVTPEIATLVERVKRGVEGAHQARAAESDAARLRREAMTELRDLGLTTTQIAALTGQSKPTVEQVLHRHRAKVASDS